MPRNASGALVETLTAWGVDVAFGMPGNGINGIMEALRTHAPISRHRLFAGALMAHVG